MPAISVVCVCVHDDNNNVYNNTPERDTHPSNGRLRPSNEESGQIESPRDLSAKRNVVRDVAAASGHD